MVGIIFYEEASIVFIRTPVIVREIGSTGLHDDRIFPYVKVVNYSLVTYTTDSITVWEIKELKF